MVRDSVSTSQGSPADMINTSKGDYIPTLDGWRAFAILWVMCFHDYYELFGPTGVLPSGWLQTTAQAGGAGVSIFFGLSGFLICTKLIEGKADYTTINLKVFYVRRFFRILPPYLLYLFVVGVLSWTHVLGIGIDWRAYLSCFVFLRNYLPITLVGEWYTGHFWSLSVEEHFYLIWPWILIVAATVRRGLRFALVAALLVGVWRSVELPLHLLNRWGLPVNETVRRTDVCLDGLLYGCFLAMLLTVPGWKERFTRWLSFPVWATCFAVFLCISLVAEPHSPLSILLAFLVPILLVGTVLRPGEFVGRMLESRPLKWVGRLSYSLYVWQQLFLRSDFADKPLGCLQTFPLNWIATFGIALISYHMVERPSIRVGHRIVAKMQGKSR